MKSSVFTSLPKSDRLPGKLAFLAVSAASLLPVVSMGVSPTTLYWDGSGNSWGLPANWSTDSSSSDSSFDPTAVPGELEIAEFNISGLNTAQALSLGAHRSALGLVFSSTGTVSITSGAFPYALTLGDYGITMNAGAGAATISADLVIAGPTTAIAFNNNSDSLLTLGSVFGPAVSGTQTLTLSSTSGGGVTVSGSIGDGSGGSVVSLVVNNTGTGVTTLTGYSTYHGTTTVSAGTLRVTGGGDVFSGGMLSVDGGATLLVDGTGGGLVYVNDVFNLGITGAGILTVQNGGSLTNTAGLLGADAGSEGTATVSGAGSLWRTDDIIVGGAGNGTLNIQQGGTVTVGSGGGVTLAQQPGSNGTLNIGAFGGATTAGTLNAGNVTGGSGTAVVNFNQSDAVYTFAPTLEGSLSVNVLSSGKTILTGDHTYSGTTTITASSLQLGDGTTDGTINNSLIIVNNGLLIFNTAGTQTYSGVISGAGELWKTGNGNQILTGNSTYTGPTTIFAGTLTVGDGVSGSLNGTTGTDLNFAGGGTFHVNQGDGGAQGMGALTFSAGESTVQSTVAVGNATLTFANVVERPLGVAANFVLNGGGSNSIVLTNFGGTATPTGTLLDKGFFFNGDSYAANDGGGFLRAYGSFGDADFISVGTGPTMGSVVPTDNVLLTGDITAQTTVDGNVNTINLGANNLTMAGAGEVLTTSGLLSSGSGNATLGSIGAFLQAGDANRELVVRVNNSGDRLTIRSGIVDNSAPGALTTAGAGTLVLSGANTYSGVTTVNTGTLEVSGGSISATSIVYVGSGGTLLVGGSSAGNVTVVSDLQVGSSGSGTLRIENGSSVSDFKGVLGVAELSSGTATVTGAGSTWTHTSNLNVGSVGVGVLNIENGGTVTNMFGNLGLLAGSSGTATVTGAGSTWTNGFLFVGNSGTGALNIENGGTVAIGNGGYVGYTAGSLGTVTVTGAGSTWTGGSLSLGFEGTGTLNIENGGTVIATNSRMGAAGDSSGTATVTGNGSIWTSTGTLFVGDLGTGTLTIENGGRVASVTGSIGFSTDSSGTATVTGPGSIWASSGNLNVGFNGTGTLAVEDGATVTSANGIIGLAGGSIGTATVIDPGSTWTNSGNLTVGSNGTGILYVDNGATVTSANGFVGTGSGSSGAAAFFGTGSNWTTSGNMTVGSGGTGTLLVANGATVASKNTVIGNFLGSSGTVTVSGPGASWVNSGNFTVGSGGTGELTLENGGALSVGGGAGNLLLSPFGGTGTLNIGNSDGFSLAGTLNAASVTGGLGSAVVNFNQVEIFTFTPILAGSLAVNQLGIGTTVLVGDHTYTGTTTIANGELKLGDGVTDGTINNSLSIVNSSALTFHNLGTQTYGGVLSGNGTVYKAGIGEQILSGTNTTTGDIVISVGTLTVGDGVSGSLSGITANKLEFYGGGTFNVHHADAGTQGMGLLTFNTGEGTIQSSFSATSATLTFADVAARNKGAAGNFVLNGGGAANKIVLTNFGNMATVAGTLLDKGLFFGGDSYAAYDAGGFVRAYGSGDTGFFSVSEDLTMGIRSISDNVLLTGNITAQTTGNGSVNTINLGAFSVTMAGTGQVLSTNGLLSSGNSTVNSDATLGGGDGILQAGSAGGELVIRVNNSGDKLTISSVIQNNSTASALTTAGAGTLVLSGNNTYTGDTSVNTGKLEISGGGIINGTATLYVNSGGTLIVDGSTSSVTVTKELSVGDSGQGTLTITNGGIVTNGDGYLGYDYDTVGTATVSGNGSTWINNGSLDIGSFGRGTLVIDAAATVSSGDGYIGSYPGSTGAVTVTGNGSAWFNSDVLDVGSSGAGTLRIEAGGAVYNSESSIGSDFGATGTATVTGSGSNWNSDFLEVGGSGTGTLRIENGGAVFVSINAIVGAEPGSTGTVTVTGNSSIWTNLGDLDVGGCGKATLLIEDGGKVSNSNGSIAFGPCSVSIATVSGTGSTWTNSESLIVGGEGRGTLRIEAGGAVFAAESSIGFDYDAIGTVTVTGSGSKWTSDYLEVGSSGTGTLRIEAGGAVLAAESSIGFDYGAIGTVTVTGNGSKWTSDFLEVGGAGTGTLRIENGGVVSGNTSFAIEPTSATIGAEPGSTGTVTVTGNGSLWTDLGSLVVGGAGRGTLRIEAGGAVLAAESSIGFDYDAIGTVTVTGSGSKWTSDYLEVGSYSTGTLRIENGGEVLAVESSIGFDSGAIGTVTLTGSGSKWTSEFLEVGSFGTGTLRIENGGVVFGNASAAVETTSTTIGAEPGSTGTVTVTGIGSLWTDLGYLDVGGCGTATLLIEAGGAVSNIHGTIAYGPCSVSVATVTGTDSIWANSGLLYVGDEGSGTLNLQGNGTVSAGDGVILASQPGSSGTLNIGAFGGATIAGTLLAGSVIGGSGTAVVNFNQTDEHTFAPALEGSLAVNQLGSGKTILTGNNIYTGGTTITQGTLAVGGTAGDSHLGNGHLDLNGGTLDLNGHNEVVAAVSTTSGIFANTSLTGSASLTGSGLTKSGTGTTTINAGVTYSGGSTVVSGGTLVVNGIIDSPTTVADTAVLGGSGQLLNSVLITSGGKTLPSAGGVVGTLASFDLQYDSGSTAAFELTSGNTTAGSTFGYDHVVVGSNLLQVGFGTATSQLASGTTGSADSGVSLTLNLTAAAFADLQAGTAPAYDGLGSNTGLNNFFLFSLEDGVASAGLFQSLSLNIDGTLYSGTIQYGGTGFGYFGSASEFSYTIGDVTVNGQQFAISYSGDLASNSTFAPGGNDLVLTAIPEPGSLVTLLGGLGILLGLRRRTSRKG